jgi:hypothetical protein
MKSLTAKMIIAIGTMVFLAGCATTFVPPSKATRAGSNRIYAPKSMLHSFPGCSVLIVTRGNGTISGSGVRIGFDIDGQSAASIWPGEKVKFYLQPGVHMLTFDHPGVRGGKQIYTQKGKAIIYSMSLGVFGNGGGRLVPKTVPNQNALAKECRE